MTNSAWQLHKSEQCPETCWYCNSDTKSRDVTLQANEVNKVWEAKQEKKNVDSGKSSE